MNAIRIAAVLFAVAVMHLSLPALAHDESHKSQGIKVVDAWAKASLAGTTNGAAFVTLSNQSGEADRIVAAETSVAAKAKLHTHLMDDGIMRMRPLAAVELESGETATMAPGGLHVMLLGLTEPLKESKSFPLTLFLERSGPVHVEVMVKAANAIGADHDAMDKDGAGHGKMKMQTD
jgi:copper(I)-binding protein